MAKLPKEIQLLLVRAILEKKRFNQRNILLLKKRADLSSAKAMGMKKIMLRNITEAEERMEEIISTGECCCFKCKKDIPTLDLGENPCRRFCEKCEKKTRKKR